MALAVARRRLKPPPSLLDDATTPITLLQNWRPEGKQ